MSAEICRNVCNVCIDCMGLVNVYLVVYVMLLMADYFKHMKVSCNDG